MCLPGSPNFTHTPGAPPPPPPPQYLHNPYLDGATFGKGSAMGRDSLVHMAVSNGLGTAGGSGTAVPVPRQKAATPTATQGNPGLTAPAGNVPNGPVVPMVLGQPGSVVPTVGGVMAGVMGGRVTSPTAPPSGSVELKARGR